MADGTIAHASTSAGLPVAPSMGPGLASVRIAPRDGRIPARVLTISGVCVALAFAAALVAQLLGRLIALVTNLAFYARISSETVAPSVERWGRGVVLVPVVGGVIVGLMARYGSKAIRGHGIPEAMEQILVNESRIPMRMTLLKPLSAAVAIGTGGPFGAEGPIIATGGALGSLVGQVLTVTAAERKVLLAAGAAAGMAATFGTPVAAILLAVELLLFEYRSRSLIPVALAAATATSVRYAFVGSAPVFASADFVPPSGPALTAYVTIGALMGLCSVGVTRIVYGIEDAFAKLPIHWMWWPALGAIPVGIIGYFVPRTLGVGYDNIEGIVDGRLAGAALGTLCAWKFVSWAIALGSGTSGGTLAPLFTIGGALGALLGARVAAVAPSWGIDPRIAGLVGMAALFAGASRALLASVVFAFETTRQPLGLLPLLGGCCAAFLISAAFMPHSIMTEKIVRRGRRVPSEYGVDFLTQISVGEVCHRPAVTLRADDTVVAVRAWLHAGGPVASHQGFPVVDDAGTVVGVVMRRDVERTSVEPEALIRTLVQRPPVVIGAERSLREAADLMVHEGLGRLPVLSSEEDPVGDEGAGPRAAEPRRLIGVLTRSDLVGAHASRLHQELVVGRALARG